MSEETRTGIGNDPIRPGAAHRTGGFGRPNPLSDPAFAREVAEAFAGGMSRAQMCETFGVKDRATITRWRRDPRVKAHAFKIIEDRILQVTRKVDGVIAARLENANTMTMKELLAIRKEFLGGQLRQRTENVDENTIGEAQDWLENNPDAVELLDEMFSGKKSLPGVE